MTMDSFKFLPIKAFGSEPFWPYCHGQDGPLRTYITTLNNFAIESFPLLNPETFPNAVVDLILIDSFKDRSGGFPHIPPVFPSFVSSTFPAFPRFHQTQMSAKSGKPGKTLEKRSKLWYNHRERQENLEKIRKRKIIGNIGDAAWWVAPRVFPMFSPLFSISSSLPPVFCKFFRCPSQVFPTTRFL